MKNIPHTIDKRTVDAKRAIPHALHQVSCVKAGLIADEQPLPITYCAIVTLLRRGGGGGGDWCKRKRVNE